LFRNTVNVSNIIIMAKFGGKKSGKMAFTTAKLSASITKETRFARSTTMLTSEKASKMNKPRSLKANMGQRK